MLTMRREIKPNRFKTEWKPGTPIPNLREHCKLMGTLQSRTKCFNLKVFFLTLQTNQKNRLGLDSKTEERDYYYVHQRTPRFHRQVSSRFQKYDWGWTLEFFWSFFQCARKRNEILGLNEGSGLILSICGWCCSDWWILAKVERNHLNAVLS